MPLDALLIDLDDTLLVEYASADEALHQTCLLAARRHTLHPDRLQETVRRKARALWHVGSQHAYAAAIGISSWEALWARFEGDHHPSLSALRASALAFRREVWSQSLAAHGVADPSLADEMADHFGQVRRTLHIVYPDVRPCLALLSARYRLGLVTNGLACLQREKLAASGLGHYFQSVTVAGDLGVAKPDPAVFRRALASLDATPQRAAMLGNSLRSDIDGARAVGLRSIWLNRQCEPPGDAQPPDAEIETLAELPDLLPTFERECAAPLA
jgi:putative hydrolase of the HAD superfamily